MPMLMGKNRKTRNFQRYSRADFAANAKAIARPRIVHLPQVHVAARIADIAPTIKSDANAIARSQYDILRKIIEQPDTPIFLEGLTDELTPASPLVVWAKDQAADVFSNGLPSSFDEMPLDQKKVLSTSVAPILAFALGWVKKVLPTTNVVFEEKLISAIEHAYANHGSLDNALMTGDDASRLRQLIFDDRENLAVARIYEWCAQNGCDTTTVYLVFGANHRFAPDVAA